uniref:Thioesterase domain-containing protein n=1 Tax=Rhizophora mucronata TaxID=61149 RepID=A0A2P2QM72_RHIMU
MELEAVRRILEKGNEGDEEGKKKNASTIESLPPKFFESFMLEGVRPELIQPGRLLCSFKVPYRLLNAGNSLHGGATATLVDLTGSAAMYTVIGDRPSGVSVEINVSYLDAAYVDEEIEIEAKVLRVGKAIAVVSIEFRNKATGKIIAQGRHTKYLLATSKM